MADSVFGSPDDGRIKLPKVDSAMNKTAPILKKGGKGGKDDEKNSRLSLSETDKQKLLTRARKRFERCCTAEADNRKAGLDDLKFINGDQWPAEIQAARKDAQRPCLTINKIPTFVHQITNDLRQNRPGIVINPTGDKGDLEAAKIYKGMIRAIERDCHADIAYDTGVESAVSNGWGYWRIITEEESPDVFDQVIRIVRIRNPFTVYLDPDRQEPDAHDSKFGFITSMMPRSEFEEEYPDAQIINFDIKAIGERFPEWGDKDNVRIAEYYEMNMKSRTLVALSNGHVGWEDELSDSVKSAIESGKLEVVKERESHEREITWYKITAVDVLDEKVWAGTEGIPIVEVVGNELDIEGKVKKSGIVRNVKDAQKMYNYWRTLETELIALQPKAPWLMAVGQEEGLEQMWKTANTDNQPYLLYNPLDVNGQAVPPPQRQAFQGAPQGVEAAVQGAAQDMMATTGIRFDATPNERLIDESGKAIHELRRSGDMGSFHYVDNMSRSLRRTGHILIDLIPKIYDRQRIITILREDDSEEQVMINPNAPKPTDEMQTAKGKMKIFNPTKGNYGVTVTIGPSYATKRIEASESMMAFAKAMPNVAQYVADLIAKNQDWEGADEIARRLSKLLPPQLLTPNQKDVPPQVQSYIQSQQQHIQQLTQQLQAAAKQLQDQNADRAIDQDKINKDFEAKIMAIVQKATAAQQLAQASSGSHEGSQLKDMALGVKALMELMKNEEDPSKKVKEDLTKEMETKHTRLLAELDKLHKTAQTAFDKIEKTDKRIDETKEHHQKTEEHVKSLEKVVKSPKKIKIKRDGEGKIIEAVAEHGG